MQMLQLEAEKRGNRSAGSTREIKDTYETVECGGKNIANSMHNWRLRIGSKK